MLRRFLNLPFTVASKAAKAFQDREDAKTRERYGTASDPGMVPVGGQETAREVTEAQVDAAATTLSVADIRAQAKTRPIAYVDVRGLADWNAGHLRGAAHMPMGEINVRVSELAWDQLVVAYCNDGALAAQAVAFFRERGMEDTFVLGGGIAAWRAAGGEVVT